jgi:Xaa-Pro aminopeptidase
MLADLDLLMQARGIGAVVVSMHEAPDPSFRWLSRGAKLTRGYAVHIAGKGTLLVHYPMERDEAAASGLITRSIHDFSYGEIFRSISSLPAAYAKFFSGILRELDATGPVAFYGHLPIQLYFPLLEHLQREGWQVDRSGEDLLQEARKRKEPWELDAIRHVGERTERVVDRVRETLRTAEIDDGVLLIDGRPLLIGDLKTLVTMEIHRLGMVEDHETILSQGRDAAIPHSRGDAESVVRASVPLVIDIFPSDRASGYFFDLTRTFCVGAIPARLMSIYDHVREAFEIAASRMRAGTAAAGYQALVCDFFEARGYTTTRTDPTTTSGYVHSLGHGVGLQLHERPSFSLQETNRDMIEIGDVLTIEPGLYFPGEGIGVRLEETFFVSDSGRVESICRSDRGLAP